MASEGGDDVRKTAAGLRLVGKALLCSFLFSAIILTLWFAGLVYQGDRIYAIHSAWFEMTRQQFDMIQYGAMAFLKLSALIFLLFPAIGIWLVARNK